MKEVEILVEVFDTKNKVLKKLKSFKKLGVKKTIDVYFYDPLRSDLKPNKSGRLNRCFRLRKKDKKTYLAYKVDNFSQAGRWVHSDEHEIEVSDLRTAENIIEHLGFKTLVEIENLKHTFRYKNYEIVLEEVKNLGLFLEVEKVGVSDKEKIGLIKKEIWHFIKSLGIKTSVELNAGKPELILKKYASKN